jgi:N-acetylneuraminate synthase
MDEVRIAVERALSRNTQLALLQCNTNYTAELENFKHIQLNVLKSYRAMYPTMVLGLSDHTLGHATVLGAVALGARIVEKHFTDDPKRVGPDHGFSMSPVAWRDMVNATRELENALGDGIKRVEANESETAILQRRSVRTTGDLPAGTELRHEHLIVLRPCPRDGIEPGALSKILGQRLVRNLSAGEHVKWTDLA